MGFKTILIPLDGTKLNEAALETALAAARRFRAHIEVLYVRPVLDGSVRNAMVNLPESVTKTILEAAERSAAEQSQEVRAAFEKFCRAHNLAIAAEPSAYPNATASLREERGSGPDVLVRRGRLADLIFVQRPDQSPPLAQTVEAALLETGRPVVVVPPKPQQCVASHIAIGWNASAEAARAVAHYEYDPFGNLTQVTDVAGNVTSLAYDLRGRKTAMHDPDMGSWTYGYNAVNELISQTDAKGQTITMAYDKLGRMTTRTTPEGTSTWTYDTATQGIGKLAVLTGPGGHQEQYVYDAHGRIAQVHYSIGGQPYSIASGYDSFGRLATITYPSTGYQVKQTYDAFGHLWQVSRVQGDGTESLLWMTNAADAHNRIIQEYYGNGVASNRAYDHETGDLQTIQTGSGGSSTNIQNLSYTFDAIDNLLSRNDAIAGLNETFSYDNLNRLTQATGAVSKTYQYDATGNITHKSDVGTYTYSGHGPNSIRPHAVTGVSGVINASYTYDANGNMTGGAGRSIAYTSFNKPQSVTQNGQTTTFAYDPNYKRIQKVTATTSTTYIGKLYEKVTTGTLIEHKHYLYAGGSLVATYTSRNNGTSDTKYIHTDHLGSTNVVTDGNGNVIERLSFDPHGKRRQTNGEDAVGTITSGVNRGFTKHEHDDEVGLINMNARLYDPILGRFITPDSLIDGPTSQGLNRYSYVRNNLLSLTDPTGNWSLKRAVKRLTKNVKRAVNTVADLHTKAVKAMHSREAIAITAAYATGGATLNLFGGSVTTGMAAGGVGGWISTGNSRGLLTGAVVGGFTGYLSNGTAYANQVTQASNFINNVATGQFGAAAATLGRTAMNYGFSLVEASIARHYGISPEAFNVGLMSLSIAGNEFTRSRFRTGDLRFASTDGAGFCGVDCRGMRGWLFDAVDVMLGYQGLPTASTRDYLTGYYAGGPISGHSLGTLDVSYTNANGLSSGGVMYSLPLGNVAPSGVQVNLGVWDAVNGGPVGWLFNPGAHGCSVGFGGHSLTSYAKGC